MNNIKQLYLLNIEIEGILRVLEQRDSVEVRELLRMKFDEYSKSIEKLLGSTTRQESVQPINEITEFVQHSIVEVPAEPTPVFIEPAPVPVTESQPVSVSEPQRTLKVDELISSRQSADLRKAFTLNDKYRFRRELFNGSDNDFSHTIDLLASMATFDEAMSFMTGDLCWDENNETVEDFITIIRRHFQA